MSITTMILGESGTGKSASMRNLDPDNTLLIQAVKKPLPFRSSHWSRFDKEQNPGGNIFVSDSHAQIIKTMSRTRRKIIVLDDFQYVLANEFMRRTDETGFTKFTEIGKHAWEILNAASSLPDDVRVYLLSHTETTDVGKIKIKTIGRMLDEKITLEGLVTICLRTVVRDGQYFFSTKNSGHDTVKSPMGLFDHDLIDNDLSTVDAAIINYYQPTEAIA